jgi:hypothetical protein
MWKYVLAWIPMVLIAILNGAIREGWYGKHLSELQAHQISTVTGVLLFGVYIWVLIRIWRPESAGQAITVGLMWLGMTVAFEFLFGHYVAKRPWRNLLHDYNLFAGHVWLVVLVWVTLTSYLFYQLQKWFAVILAFRRQDSERLGIGYEHSDST